MCVCVWGGGEISLLFYKFHLYIWLCRHKTFSLSEVIL